jgi:hypothetical protein
VQSFGTWGGDDPLGGERSEPRPGPVALITHSRTRVRDPGRFFVAYAPGVHQSAVKSQRDGGWFSESWFARFAIEAAVGNWRGVRADDLTAEPAAL